MKRAVFILMITVITITMGIATACNSSGSDTIPNGTYEKKGGGLGIGDEFTVKGSTLTVSMGILGSVDYTYKINGNEIKLTAQGGTLSYAFEKSGASYFINEAEYAIKSDSVVTNAGKSDDTATETETAEKPPAQIYDPLNLPITMTEQTFSNSSYIHYITQNGNLIETKRETETTIDSNVRSLLVSGSSIFYIKNDNSLWGYGRNYNGRLGDGTGVDQEKPVKIMDDVAWVGTYSTNGVIFSIKTDKTYWTWGDGVNYSPVMIAENVVKGLTDEIVLTGEGMVVNYKTNAIPEYFPSEPVYDVQFLKDVSFGPMMGSIYIDSNRNLYLMNLDENWEFKISLIAKEFEKFNVNFGYPRTIGIHFIKSDGALWGYGANNEGQLGDGTKVPERTEAIKIADDVVGVCDYAFLKPNGEFWAWDSENPTPRKVLDDISHIAYTDEEVSWSKYVCVVTANGEILYYYTSDGRISQKLENVKTPTTITFP